MNVVRTIADLRHALAGPRRAGLVGFVPTMGALHAGHAALFAYARRECGHVIASVFVNPKQFNDAADLAAYPRQEGADVQLATDAGVDTIFVPSADEIFPVEHSTMIAMRGAAIGFEGDHRPGHFDGVALVCAKLFAITAPHRAYFGQKDAQQVAVLRQLVRDLNLDLTIVTAPTVRDADSLALSSRNVRLSASDRVRARAIPAALEAGLRAHQRGQDPVAAARTLVADIDLEYLAVARFEEGATLVLAARVGNTRLIDNVPLDDPERAGFAAGRTGSPVRP